MYDDAKLKKTWILNKYNYVLFSNLKNKTYPSFLFKTEKD